MTVSWQKKELFRIQWAMGLCRVSPCYIYIYLYYDVSTELPCLILVCLNCSDIRGYNRPGVAYLSYKHNCDLKKLLTETHFFLIKSKKLLTAKIVRVSDLNWSPNSILPTYPPPKQFGGVSFINGAKGTKTWEKSAHIWTLSKGGGEVQPKSKLSEALFFCFDLDIF